VAVATKGGGRINQHFGHAKEFQVYEVSGRGIEFIGHRKVDNYCQGGFGEDATLDAVIEALEGVTAVLCAKIGDCPKDSLEAAHIKATDAYALEWIEAGVAAWYQAEVGGAAHTAQAV
jgi:nitrogen fixation protein NifB